jgi:Protein of unknown function (DUF3574)
MHIVMKRPGHALLFLGVLIVFLAIATAVFGQGQPAVAAAAPLPGASQSAPAGERGHGNRRFDRRVLSALMLIVNTVAPGLTDARQEPGVRSLAEGRTVIQRPAPGDAKAGALAFVRSELYFGTARPYGMVTEAEFRDFVDRHVTPRFPDGLTLLKGDGQFRGEGDTIIKEQSFVLILLYPYATRDKSSGHIERIRARYKEEFAQESVLRIDDPSIVWVWF